MVLASAAVSEVAPALAVSVIGSRVKARIEAGKVKPFIGKTVTLAEVPAAIRSMQEEQVIGRIVVTPAG